LYVTLFLWHITGRCPYIELYEVDSKMTGDGWIGKLM